MKDRDKELVIDQGPNAPNQPVQRTERRQLVAFFNQRLQGDSLLEGEERYKTCIIAGEGELKGFAACGDKAECMKSADREYSFLPMQRREAAMPPPKAL